MSSAVPGQCCFFSCCGASHHYALAVGIDLPLLAIKPRQGSTIHYLQVFSRDTSKIKTEMLMPDINSI